MKNIIWLSKILNLALGSADEQAWWYFYSTCDKRQRLRGFYQEPKIWGESLCCENMQSDIMGTAI